MPLIALQLICMFVLQPPTPKTLDLRCFFLRKDAQTLCRDGRSAQRVCAKGPRDRTQPLKSCCCCCCSCSALAHAHALAHSSYFLFFFFFFFFHPTISSFPLLQGPQKKSQPIQFHFIVILYCMHLKIAFAAEIIC